MSNDAKATPNLDGQNTLALDWANLANEARAYLRASSWKRALGLLSGPIQDSFEHGSPPEEALECICLYIAACWRLSGESRYTEAIRWLQRHATTYPIIPDRLGVIVAHSLAQAEANAGGYRTARKILEEIPQAILGASNPWDAMRLDLLWARLDIREGRLSRAEKRSLKAAMLAAEPGYTGLQGDAFAVLGCIAKMRGHFEESSSLCAEAAQHYWRAGDLSGHAMALLNRAIALLQMGFLKDSLFLFQDVLNRAEALNRRGTALRAQIGIAEASLRAGSLESSRRLLLEAWREARRIGLAREEALALEFLAETHMLMGAVKKARVTLSLCERKIERGAPNGDVSLEITIRTAMLALAENRPWKAIPLARKAIKHATQIDMPWELGQGYRVLGIALAHHGKKSHANAAFKKSLACFVRIGELLERRVVQVWLRALDLPLARAPGPTEESRIRAQLTETLIKGAISLDTKERDSLESTLRFWLNHHLLGPIPWVLGKGRKRPRTVPFVETPLRQTKSTIESHQKIAIEGGDSAGLHSLWDDLGLVTRTAALRDILKLAETYATGDIPVLILGETGTGKDLLARGVHVLSGRRGHWVPVNCAAARKELFVAELFGARKGAYTGATSDRRGLAEDAVGGTLFFDEIADLDHEAQGFLLRFLDSGEIRSLGDTRSRRVETRILAATCRKLSDLVAIGRFRADLYARLAGLVLRIPPLRERLQDIPLLLEMLWCRENGLLQEFRDIFTGSIQSDFCREDWPGNVRQLKHLVDRVRIYTRFHGTREARRMLQRGSFSENMTGVGKSSASRISISAKRRMHSKEMQGISIRPRDVSPEQYQKALEMAGGHILEAGRILGLPRSTSYRLHEKFRRMQASEDPESG